MILLRAVLAAAAAMFSCVTLASCPAHSFADPARMQIDADALLVVVHPSSLYDSRVASKRGIDQAVRFSKDRRIPVVYLQDDAPLASYFVDDCEPTWWVESSGGEVRFDVGRARHLYVAGGHLELCMSTALHEILLQWSRKPVANLRVTYLMDAVYSNGKAIDPGDPFYGDFGRFLSIVTYGRPGGEHWPKLTLLETMGIIRKEEHELDYIRQILPRWDRTFGPQVRVEVRLNNSVSKVLRPAPGWNPPTLTFHFVNSAFDLGAFGCQRTSQFGACVE